MRLLEESLTKRRPLGEEAMPYGVLKSASGPKPLENPAAPPATVDTSPALEINLMRKLFVSVTKSPVGARASKRGELKDADEAAPSENAAAPFPA